MSELITDGNDMVELPKVITPGTKAFYCDPAGRGLRDGDPWCPVVLTGNEDVWNLSGVRCVEIKTSSGRGRWLDADQMRRPAQTRGATGMSERGAYG